MSDVTVTKDELKKLVDAYCRYTGVHVDCSQREFRFVARMHEKCETLIPPEYLRCRKDRLNELIEGFVRADEDLELFAGNDAADEARRALRKFANSLGDQRNEISEHLEKFNPVPLVLGEPDSVIARVKVSDVE